jgi:hypothetical protein
MNKILFVSLLMVLYLGPTYAVNSGVKLGIDTYIFNYLKTIDLNKYVKGNTIIDHIGKLVEKKTFPDYRLFVSDLTITNVANPSDVNVTTRVDATGNKILNVVVNSIVVESTLSFELSAIWGAFSDKGLNTPVTVQLKTINGEFFFKDGGVHFTRFHVEIGKVDIHFKSIILEYVYKFLGGFIIEFVNKFALDVRADVERAMNKFIFEPAVINLGNTILIDLTNVDRPDLDIYTKVNPQSLVYLEETSNDFLQKQFTPMENTSSAITFGVVGAIYPFDPHYRPACDPAVQMEFMSMKFEKKINLLLSDFTINNVLYMAQQTGMMAHQWTQETENIFDVPLDTDGLSAFIPELKTTFDTTRKVDVKASIGPKLSQPIIRTSSSGVDVTYKWRITFEVYETDDPLDFPVEYLTLEFDSFVNVNFLTHSDYVQVLLSGQKINHVTAVVNNLKDYDPSKKPELLINLFGKILDANMQKYGNVKVYEILKSYTGLDFKDASITAQNGYYSLAIDIE